MLFLPGACLAQIDQANSLGLSVGITNAQVRDEIAVNLRHSGFVPEFQAYFLRDQSGLVHSALARYHNSYGYSRYLTDAQLLSAGLNYACLWNVWQSNDRRLRVLLGPGADLVWDVQYYSQVINDHFFWFTHYALQARAGAQWLPSPSYDLTASLEVPVISLTSRPPLERDYRYDSEDLSYIIGKIHEDMRVDSYNRYFALDAGLAFRYHIGARVQQRLRYSFSYDYYYGIGPIRLLSHTLGLDVSYAW